MLVTVVVTGTTFVTGAADDVVDMVEVVGAACASPLCVTTKLLMLTILGLSPSLLAGLGLEAAPVTVVLVPLPSSTADGLIIGGVAVLCDVELDTMIDGVIILELVTVTVALI